MCTRECAQGCIRMHKEVHKRTCTRRRVRRCIKVGADRGLDWPGGGEQQHVDPGRHGVDEGLGQRVGRDVHLVLAQVEQPPERALPAHPAARAVALRSTTKERRRVSKHCAGAQQGGDMHAVAAKRSHSRADMHAVATKTAAEQNTAVGCAHDFGDVYVLV